jgi:hypothetical protein
MMRRVGDEERLPRYVLVSGADADAGSQPHLGQVGGLQLFSATLGPWELGSCLCE